MGTNRKRFIVEVEDKEEIIRLYRRGFSISEISIVTGFSDSTVRGLIKENTGKYTEIDPASDRGQRIIKTNSDRLVFTPKKDERKSEEELKDQVIALHSKGYSINKIISEVKDLTRTEIENILFDKGLIERDSEGRRIKKSVDMSDIRKFAKSIKIGDVFTVRAYFHDLRKAELEEEYVTATVQKKYRNVVLTDKGSYSYIDLYLLKQD